METDQTTLTPRAMPKRLADVFQSLRRGRHICREDGADYHDLERNEDKYGIIFDALGYDLEYHNQGFYYLKGDSYLSSQRLQAVTVFVLILFQDLEDKKYQQPERAWERTLLTRVFNVDELPHFETAQRRNVMHMVGVTPDELHKKVIQTLSRLGMLEPAPPGQTRFFRFRSPIFRFVDLCMKYAEEEWNISFDDDASSSVRSANASNEGNGEVAQQ